MVGHLNIACRVVASSRVFLRRLYDSMGGLHKPFHRTRMTWGMRQDLGYSFNFWKALMAYPFGEKNETLLRNDTDYMH